MIKTLSIVAVIATVFTGAGAAEAGETYGFTKSWTMTRDDDGNHTTPPMQDGEVEASCRTGDQIEYYRFKDMDLVLEVRHRDDGTGGVYVTPDFNAVPQGESRVLEVEMRCMER